MDRRAIFIAAATGLMAGNIGRSVAQEAIPTSDDLFEVFKDVRRINLLLLNISFLYSALEYHIFRESGISSLQDLSKYSKLGDIGKDRSEFFSLYYNLLDEKTSQIVVESLSKDDPPRDVIQKIGEAAAGPARSAVEFLSKAGVNPPPESIISLIEFSQAAAVVNEDLRDVPVLCRYFPFSYFC
jgi:hypothetical protein